MFRIDDATAVSVLPTPETAATEGYFTEGTPGVVPATLVRGSFLNMVQEELRAIVTAAGLTPSKTVYTQIRDAIRTIFQRNDPSVCAAGGTSDALTGTYTPAITSLTNGMSLYLRTGSANTTTTPTFTPNSGVITAYQIVKGAGAALAPGDIAGGGHWIELQWDSTLTKWVILNPATGVSAASVSTRGSFANLQASATGLSANVTVTADEIVVENASNTYATLRAISLTIAGTSSGVANGLDTGSLAASTWYSVWAIWNGTTAAGLLSLSATTPTMPSGYTHKARVGWIRTDASGNKYPLSFIQMGRKVQYKVAAGSNVTALPQMASGTPGSMTAVGVSNFVPSTAAEITAQLSGAYLNAGSYGMAAPNAAYTNANMPLWALSSSTNSSVQNATGSLVLESTNIYYQATATTAVNCMGWTDNL